MEDYKDLVEYIDIAKKIISTFADKICPGICNEMSKSEDAVADVAHALMMADWKYDENRKGKVSNQVKTRYSYRNQCAIWAIQTYIKKYLKHKSYSIHNILDDESGITFEHSLEDDSQIDPIESIIEKEKTDLEKQMINDIFSSDLLSETQKDKLRLYYFDNLSLAKIGNKYGVTREAIRQNIKVSIKRLKEALV